MNLEKEKEEEKEFHSIKDEEMIKISELNFYKHAWKEIQELEEREKNRIKEREDSSIAQISDFSSNLINLSRVIFNPELIREKEVQQKILTKANENRKNNENLHKEEKEENESDDDLIEIEIDNIALVAYSALLILTNLSLIRYLHIEKLNNKQIIELPSLNPKCDNLILQVDSKEVQNQQNLRRFEFGSTFVSTKNDSKFY